MGAVCFLAVDAGTTRVKAALVDDQGSQVDAVGASLHVIRPFDGASELDMEEVWHVFCQLTRILAQRNPDSMAHLGGIGITGQGDGLWPVDKHGAAVRNAILWNDTRTRDVEILDRASLDEFCVVHAITPLFPGASPLLLKWVEENEAGNFGRIDKVLHCKDWLNFKLTGSLATDYSDASTALLNVLTRTYVGELFEKLDVGVSKELYPALYDSIDVVGVVTPSAAQESRLPAGVPVIAGAIDVAAVAAGAGAMDPGEAVTIVGTTLCNEVVLSQEEVDHTDTHGSVLCHLFPNRYLRVMANSSGTSSLDWARQALTPAVSFQALEAEMASIPVGSEGVLFHPYLSGERAPFKNALARGGFYGLAAHHTRYHLVRAAYEGLALSLYDCYQYLPDTEQVIYIGGGGAASDFLCQMFADCLGKPLRRPVFDELGLLGITKALWAARGMEISLEDTRGEQPGRLFVPDMEKHVAYLQLYGLFLEMRHASEEFWRKRSEFLA